MNRTWKWLAVLAVVGGGVAAWAQNSVHADQGKPGNQGPWPVTIGGASISLNAAFDGGFIGSVSTQPCSALISANTDAGTVAATVPSSPAAGRTWIQICNTQLNTSTAQCICSAGQAKPTFSAGSPGDVLATGDCALYNISALDGGVPWCICNGSNVALASTECLP